MCKCLSMQELMPTHAQRPEEKVGCPSLPSLLCSLETRSLIDLGVENAASKLQRFHTHNTHTLHARIHAWMHTNATGVMLTWLQCLTS